MLSDVTLERIGQMVNSIACYFTPNQTQKSVENPYFILTKITKKKRTSGGSARKPITISRSFFLFFPVMK